VSKLAAIDSKQYKELVKLAKLTKIKDIVYSENLILGAGVTGITAASMLEGKKDYIVLDKNKHMGGMMRPVFNKKSNILYSTSGHFLHFKDQKNKEFFSNLVKLKEKQRNSSIFVKDDFVAQPFQMNFLDHKNIDFKTKLLSDFVCAQKNKPKAFFNFKDYLLKNYGQALCDAFLFSYNEKLYGDLNLLEIDSMKRFFPKNDLKEFVEHISTAKIKNIGYNSKILFPESGNFADILLRFLSNYSKIFLETEITSIDTKNRIVLTKDKRLFAYKNLVSTISFKEFLRLTKDKNYSKFKASTIKVFNMTVKNSNNLWSKDWVYFPEKEFEFFRIGSYTNILGANVLNKLYIECKKNATEEKVIKDLIKLKIIVTKNDIIDITEIVLEESYNIITKDNTKYFEKTEKKMKQHDILFAGRYGRWSYGGVEDCFEDGKKVANLILKGDKK